MRLLVSFAAHPAAGAGPAGMFAFIAIAHLALIVFGLIRLQVGRTAPLRTPYVYAPRTSFLIGRLMSRLRERGANGNGGAGGNGGKDRKPDGE